MANRDEWDDGDEGGDPCACGRHCAESDYQGNPRRGPRPFCVTDRGYIRRAIRDLPEIYVQLHTMLPRSMQQQEHVSGSREAPVPLNVTVEAFMRQLVHVALAWDYEVREAASLSAVRFVRDGQALAEACKRLAGEGRDNDGHLDTLLGLEASPQRRFVSPGRRLGDLEPGTVIRIDSAGDAWHDKPMDGTQAGLEFLALNGKARAMIGLTRQRRRITEVPCDGCRGKTLVQSEAKAGGWEPVIRCTACPTSYVGAAYDLLVGRIYKAQLEALAQAS